MWVQDAKEDQVRSGDTKIFNRLGPEVIASLIVYWPEPTTVSSINKREAEKVEEYRIFGDPPLSEFQGSKFRILSGWE